MMRVANGLSRATICGLMLAGICILPATSIPASAQVAYDERPVLDPFSPYDEFYGVSPSFEIFPRRNGFPAVRVVERCQYPQGWNVTDFGRDVNGIPAGVDHTCRRVRLRDRY